MHPTRRNALLFIVFVGLVVVFVILSQPTAPPTRAAVPTSQTYLVFLPFVVAPDGLRGKGMASTAGGQFNNLLSADWYYVWGWCDQSGCVPMVRNWELPPNCPKILMLGNEPNTVEPYGHTMSPEDAAAISNQIRSMCPSTWLLAGNVALPQFLGIPGIEWMQRYLAARGQADQLGAHCYVGSNGTAQQCADILTGFVAAFPSWEICITEFNTGNRQSQIFQDLFQYVRSNFMCYAAFTDRDANWQVYGINYNMVNDDGTLNAYGEIYKNQ